VYVEGGGDGVLGRQMLRQGFRDFFGRMLGGAEPPEVTACGGRTDAFADFGLALKETSGSSALLLVDSEGPVSSGPWEHLRSRKRDGWRRPNGARDDQCHLMVQEMEAWFIADPEALARFYGFDRAALPEDDDLRDVERFRKKKLRTWLTQAAALGAKAHRYKELAHGPELLEEIDPAKVRSRAAHCERLFQTLDGLLAGGA
jgi:hypothetical protein